MQPQAFLKEKLLVVVFQFRFTSGSLPLETKKNYSVRRTIKISSTGNIKFNLVQMT